MTTPTIHESTISGLRAGAADECRTSCWCRHSACGPWCSACRRCWPSTADGKLTIVARCASSLIGGSTCVQMRAKLRPGFLKVDAYQRLRTRTKNAGARRERIQNNPLPEQQGFSTAGHPLGARHLVGDPEPVAGGRVLRADGELTAGFRTSPSLPSLALARREHLQATTTKNARSPRVLCQPCRAAKLRRLLVHRAARRRRAADRLHRTFDRSP